MNASKFVIVCDCGYYGTVATLKEAAENAIKEGAAKSHSGNVAYCYTGSVEQLKEVVVTGYGDISHPAEVVSTRLFGPQCKITLGQLSRDVQPKY